MTKFFRGAILGAPGSGKGTISNKIVKTFDIHHISTGDILRQQIQEGTKLGLSANKFIMEGKLVPDLLVNEITMKQLDKLSDKNWLLDGYPRTVFQAEKLFETYPLVLAIKLHVPFDVILQRIKGRWIHPASGRVYNTDYKPPKVHGIDDETGEPLIQREDDREEAVLKRLEVHEKMFGPLLKFYEKQHILKVFEGDTSDDIWPLIKEEISKYIKPKS